MEVISYNKHYGLLNPDDNSVMFYGMGFKDICDAMKFLKDLEPPSYRDEYIYQPWHYNMHKGLLHIKTKQIYLDSRWLPNEKFAEQYVDTKKKTSI